MNYRSGTTNSAEESGSSPILGTAASNELDTVPARVAQQRRLVTVLLVEDEVFVRKVTAEVLESAGYRVIIARDATEALETSRKCPQPVDLLLSDVVMPGMNGRELATKFESLCPWAGILLMTGYPDQIMRQVSTKNYLIKPFSTRTLLGMVRGALGKNLADSLQPT